MIEIYTDGSCRQNKIGGYGFIIVKDNEIIDRFINKKINTTNQRMELSAILSAYKYCETRNITDATIFSDSSYCLNCAFEKWYIRWEQNGYKSTKGNNVLNQDLWKQLIPYYKNSTITLMKVPGHKNCYYNNFIDSLVTTITDGRTIDLTGQKFNDLTVLQLWGNKFTEGINTTFWLCECKCGNKTVVSHTNLHSGGTKSCGCAKHRECYEDLTNQQFGYLIPIKKIGKTDSNYAIWECLCNNCGTKIQVSSNNLKAGQISCGCIKSKGEYKISQLLNQMNISYKKEIKFKDLIDNDLLKFDFGIYHNENLIAIIEYQGQQHYKIGGCNSWNNIKHLTLLQKHDTMKRQYCKKHNIRLIEIPYTDYDKLSIEYLEEKINEYTLDNS